MALNILYQDPYLVAIDKPPGMLVHPGREPEPKEHIAMKVLRDQLGHLVHTVHRLDRPTSGVLLYALDTKTEAATQALFESGKMGKTYLAVVAGHARKYWDCEQPLQKSSVDPQKNARTRFKRISYHSEYNLSMVECYPETGRHHQIRKHLSGGGFPILGDHRHGNPDANQNFTERSGISRMMLLAQSLEFQHPITGSPIIIEADWPEPFTDIATWR